MAAINTTLDQVMSDLSALLGETSVPNPVPANRQIFAQRALERIYRSFNFDLADVNVTLQMLGGICTLTSDVNINDPILDVRIKNDIPGEGVGGDFIFTKIPYENQDSYGPADYVYWITGSPGAYILNTAQAGDSSTSNAILSIRYMQVAPTINSSIGTPFPSSMVVARGALVDYWASQDPYMDVSQLEALFQNQLEEVVSTQIRNQPDKPAVTRHQVRGTFIGDVDVILSGTSDLGAAL